MKAPVHRYWKYAAILTALILAEQIYENYTTKQALEDVFHYDTEITVVDADTGERIEQISSGGPGLSSADLFQQSSDISPLGDGQIRISGVAYEPRPWRIWSEGYEEVTIALDRESPCQMRVELSKK